MLAAVARRFALGALLSLVLAVIATLAVSRAHAQSGADSLTWEFVGDTFFEARGLFAPGVNDDLTPAVYAIGLHGLFVIHPCEDDWTLFAEYPSPFSNNDIFVTRMSTLLANDFQRVERSIDDGQTWAIVNDGSNVAPVHTPAGTLITGYDSHPSDTVTRSTDDGLTWEQIDMWPTLSGRILPLTFATLPVSEELPVGRLIAGGNDVIVYSDDDGLSWEPTNIYAGFRYRINSIVRAPWGLLYAAVNDFAENDIGGVWESADGAAWTRVGQIEVPVPDNGGAQIVALGDSVLFAINPGEREDIQVYGSTDRGWTWTGTGQIAVEEVLGNGVYLNELIAGPEGRLWLGVSGAGPGTNGGVFRTVEPVVAVSAEGGPEPGKPGAELGAAYPNPSSGSVTVPLVLPEAAEVSVAVFDVLGRQVAVLHEGWLAAGTHRLVLDEAELPSGLYLVRVEGGGAQLSRRVTLMR